LRTTRRAGRGLEQASCRGLLAVGRNPSYPIRDSTYIRTFGTGVRQHGAAAVFQSRPPGKQGNALTATPKSSTGPD